MKALLHIGLPKTGSSALQMSLFQNKEILFQHGIYYYFDYNDFKSRNLAAFVKQDRPLYLKGRFREQKELDNSLKHLSKSVSDSVPSLTVLSAEELLSPFIGEKKDSSKICGVHEMAKWLYGIFEEIYVVVYVRRPDSFYAAFMQERVKRSPDVILPSKFSFNLGCALQNYRDAFSNDLMVFDIEETKGDIVRHFMGIVSKLGCPIPEDISPQSVNETLSNEAVCLLFWLQSRSKKYFKNHYSYHSSERIVDIISRLDRSIPGRKKCHISQSASHEVLRNSEWDIEYLEKKHNIKWNYAVSSHQSDFRNSIFSIFPVNNERYEALWSGFVTKLVNSKVRQR